MGKLEDLLGLGQVLQPVPAQRAQGRAGGESGRSEEEGRGLGDQRLPAVGGSEQAGGASGRGPEVVPLPQFRRPGVQGEADAQGAAFREVPRLGVEGELGGQGRREGVLGPFKGGVEGVAAGLEDVPAAVLQRLSQQGVVACEGTPHAAEGAAPTAGCCPGRPRTET